MVLYLRLMAFAIARYTLETATALEGIPEVVGGRAEQGFHGGG